MNTVIDSVVSVYHKTQLNGVLDEIIDALMSFVNALLQYIFQPVLYFVYEVVIWVPLQVINALNILFKFFAAGFANQIFGGQLNPDGTISYSFSFSSPLGQIMMYVLILCFILFFLYFLMGFIVGQNNGISAFLALKWPLAMILILTLTPAILIIADSFMGALLGGMDNSTPRKLSIADVANLKQFFIASSGSGQDFNQLITMQTSCHEIFTIFYNSSDKDDNTTLQWYVNEALSKIDEYSGDDDYNFGIIKTYLQYLQDHINTIQTYMNSGLTNDFNSTLEMVNSWQPGDAGMFISDANASAISALSTNLTTLQMNFNSLQDDLKNLNLPECQKGWDALLTADAALTKASICDKLQTICNSLNNFDSPSQLGYYVGVGKSATGTYSLLTQMISTTTNYPSLAHLFWYRPITPPATVVETLYQLITGDTNPNNWFVLPGIWSGSILGRMTVFQWVAGTFALWGMILVMYSFTASAIKRTYYIIGYWIIGFFYIANAQKDSAAAVKWYKMIWGKWIGILVMYILYTMASALVTIISDAIRTGLSDETGYTFGGVNLLVFFGIMLAIEAAYQTAYQISQAYMGEFGAKDEQFQSQSPLSLLSQGNALFNSALKSAEYYGTGGPVKDAYNKVDSYKEYWAQKHDTKLNREQANWNKANRAAEQDGKMIKGGKDAGYDFSKRGDSGVDINGPSGKPYGGSPGTPAVPGGAGAAPVPAVPPTPDDKVKVPTVFANYRSGGAIDAPVDHWYQGKTVGARLGNIGRAAVAGLAAVGDKALDAGAWLTRKTGIAGAAIGLSGLIGGEKAAGHASRIFGDSNNRISRSEKEWAKHNGNNGGTFISKNRNTGAITIGPPVPPMVGGARDSASSTLSNDGSVWY